MEFLSSALIGTLTIMVAIIALTSACVMYAIKHTYRFNLLIPYFIHTSHFASILLTIVFGFLIYCFVITDLSLLLVYNHSHSLKPLIYKISGTWGNHEGSMLMISLVIAWFTALYTRNIRKQDPTPYHETTIFLLFLLQLALLVFLVKTSNPFAPNPIFASEGLGLNPLLQDIGLALHPPVLYLGYIGLAVPFACALSALIHTNNDKSFADELSFWSLISWSFLTLGIGIGSWWAYRELGWGGFWFWDPVENASLMPWLAAMALLHSVVTLRKSNHLRIWTILLAILSFSLSLIGIFLVRSGVLTSVHSFASDPTRGLFILALIGTVVVVSMTLFTFRASKLSTQQSVTFMSRESMMLFGGMCIMVCCATVLLGTLYPLFMELTSGKSISVGAPYFNKTFNNIALLVLLCTIVTPALAWKKRKKSGIKPMVYIRYGIITALAIMLAVFMGLHSVTSYLALIISLWLAASLFMMIKRNNGIKAPQFSMLLGHLGVGMLCFALAFLGDLSIEKETYLNEGDSFTAEPITVTLNKIDYFKRDNYIGQAGIFSLFLHDNPSEVAVLTPEYRFYPVERQHTTETSIHSHLFYDIYLAIGERDDNGVAVRVYYKPMISFLWLGCILMSIGGLFGAYRLKRSHVNRT
ncbi:MAG: heme lyase CcmF/NrfE family subunit [Rickettsiales bacterium]|nr:heme lyase CcmF/NrfE family subunit [Rickettsiales bacterium]